jgi:hypothetical protein
MEVTRIDNFKKVFSEIQRVKVKQGIEAGSGRVGAYGYRRRCGFRNLDLHAQNERRVQLFPSLEVRVRKEQDKYEVVLRVK